MIFNICFTPPQPNQYCCWVIFCFSTTPPSWPLLLHTLLPLHRSSSHTLKSTLHGGFQYPGHLPSQSLYPLDLWGADHNPPRSTGPLSFRHGGFPVGRLCTQQTRYRGTAWAQGFIRTTCLCGSTISQTSLFPPQEEENNFDCFLLTCMPSSFSESVRMCVFYFFSLCVYVWFIIYYLII